MEEIMQDTKNRSFDPKKPCKGECEICTCPQKSKVSTTPAKTEEPEPRQHADYDGVTGTFYRRPGFVGEGP